jgi:hypothetical protein
VLWNSYRFELGLETRPDTVDALSTDHRRAIKAAGARGPWPGASEIAYREFVLAVAQVSAERWLASVDTSARREEMVWRLLRLQAAPYFVLGAGLDGTPLRYRVGTPWDFRSAWQLRSFDVWPDPAGQPLVRWRADVTSSCDGSRKAIEGHVEIRWSHGRFSGAPEAKVHLDTAAHDVAGYVPLT